MQFKPGDKVHVTVRNIPIGQGIVWDKWDADSDHQPLYSISLPHEIALAYESELMPVEGE